MQAVEFKLLCMSDFASYNYSRMDNGVWTKTYGSLDQQHFVCFGNDSFIGVYLDL